MQLQLGLAAAATALLLAVDARTQGGVAWQQVAQGGPPAQVSLPMAYDAVRQRLVLHTSDRNQPETWEWDGASWTRHNPQLSPPVNYDFAMAYDAARQRTVLCGGVPFATWEWDGVNWSRAAPATSPPDRQWHAMAYHAARQRVVLFGGERPAPGVGQELGDTWLWDGVSWTVAGPGPAPPARLGHALAYDAARQEVMLFGGLVWTQPCYQCWFPVYHADTWVWDGSWTQRPVTGGPAGRGNHGMTYDAARQRVVLFGGSDSVTPTFPAAAWEWDGASWAPLGLAAGPAPRIYSGMAYDAARRRVTVFGGFDGVRWYADTWQCRSVAPGSFTAFGPPSNCPGSSGNLTLDAAPHSLPWGGDAFTVRLDGLPGGCLPVLVLGSSNATWSGGPLPRDLSGLGLPGCTQLVAMDAVVALPATGAAATWTQSIPLAPAFVGWSFYLQGAALAAGGANPLGLALSNGGVATVGLR